MDCCHLKIMKNFDIHQLIVQKSISTVGPFKWWSWTSYWNEFLPNFQLILIMIRRKNFSLVFRLLTSLSLFLISSEKHGNTLTMAKTKFKLIYQMERKCLPKWCQKNRFFSSLSNSFFFKVKFRVHLQMELKLRFIVQFHLKRKRTKKRNFFFALKADSLESLFSFHLFFSILIWNFFLQKKAYFITSWKRNW